MTEITPPRINGFCCPITAELVQFVEAHPDIPQPEIVRVIESVLNETQRGERRYVPCR